MRKCGSGIPPVWVRKVCGCVVEAFPHRVALKASLHTRDATSIPVTTSSWSLSTKQPARQKPWRKNKWSREQRLHERKGAKCVIVKVQWTWSVCRCDCGGARIGRLLHSHSSVFHASNRSDSGHTHPGQLHAEQQHMQQEDACRRRRKGTLGIRASCRLWTPLAGQGSPEM